VSLCCIVSTLSCTTSTVFWIEGGHWSTQEKSLAWISNAGASFRDDEGPRYAQGPQRTGTASNHSISRRGISVNVFASTPARYMPNEPQQSRPEKS
jgi:hypothetical protein